MPQVIHIRSSKDFLQQPYSTAPGSEFSDGKGASRTFSGLHYARPILHLVQRAHGFRLGPLPFRRPVLRWATSFDIDPRPAMREVYIQSNRPKPLDAT